MGGNVTGVKANRHSHFGWIGPGLATLLLEPFKSPSLTPILPDPKAIIVDRAGPMPKGPSSRRPSSLPCLIQADLSTCLRIKVWCREMSESSHAKLVTHLTQTINATLLEFRLERALRLSESHEYLSTKGDNPLAHFVPIFHGLLRDLENMQAPSLNHSLTKIRLPAWDVHSVLRELHDMLHELMPALPSPIITLSRSDRPLARYPLPHVIPSRFPISPS